MKKLLLIMLVLANSTLFAASASKSIEIKSIISHYTNSIYSADVKSLKNLFHSNAVLTGKLPAMFVSGGPEQFIKDIASRPSMKSQNINFKYAITYLDVQGNVASVTLEEENFFGKLTFVNYLSLVKEKDEWKIISKIFTVKK